MLYVLILVFTLVRLIFNEWSQSDLTGMRHNPQMQMTLFKKCKISYLCSNNLFITKCVLHGGCIFLVFIHQ